MSPPIVSLRGVSFTYRGAPRPALCDVMLELRRGELAVLMGATGAGKSTLARCLNGSIPQFYPGTLTGIVDVLGRSLPAAGGVADLAGLVALVAQDFEAQLFATNVRQEVAFGMEQLGVPPVVMRERLETALARVGLRGFETRDPGTLSGGEKQRLAIAAALALEPPLLVLDEPSTDLDPLGKAELFAVLADLRGGGTTILLIEHETAAAEMADRLLLMEDGRIVADGPPGALLADVERLERLGVRPLDLDRLAHALGWRERAPTIEAAAARLVRCDAGTDDAPHGGGAAVVEVTDVELTYPSGVQALAGVSLAMGEGELLAIIGRNGSGKTTLARCLNGLLRPQRGTVRVRGRPLGDLPLNRVAAEVGYVFQNPDEQIFASSVADEVAFGPRNLGLSAAAVAARVERALAAVGLSDCASLDPFLLGKGARQRLAIASVLALEPAVLVLDEPTTGLDDREQRQVLDLLAGLHAEGLTVVLITHTPWVVARYATRAVVMERGRVAFDGGVQALFREEALLARCHFQIPDAARLAARLGTSARTVEELLQRVRPVG